MTFIDRIETCDFNLSGIISAELFSAAYLNELTTENWDALVLAYSALDFIMLLQAAGLHGWLRSQRYTRLFVSRVYVVGALVKFLRTSIVIYLISYVEHIDIGFAFGNERGKTRIHRSSSN